jgi:hypothetical protein
VYGEIVIVVAMVGKGRRIAFCPPKNGGWSALMTNEYETQNVKRYSVEDR